MNKSKVLVNDHITKRVKVNRFSSKGRLRGVVWLEMRVDAKTGAVIYCNVSQAHEGKRRDNGYVTVGYVTVAFSQ